MADSLDRAGNREAALAILDPIVDQARAANDSLLLADSLRLKGRVYFITNRVPESEVLLRESLSLAQAAADTNLQVETLNILAYVLRVQGKREESRGLYENQLAMATATGDKRAQASALQILADDEHEAGRFEKALEQYRLSLTLFEGERDTLRICTAFLRIGACEAEMGDPEAGRRTFTRCAELAEGRPGFERVELAARGNVAMVDKDLGDPGRALAEFERVYEIERRIGSLFTAAITARNMAEARLELDQPTAAAALLEELLPEIRSANLEHEEIELQIALGAVRERQHRPADAASLYREILARPAGSFVENRMHAIRGLARCLAAQDSSQAALALLEDSAPLLERGTRKIQVLFDQDLADALMNAERMADALAVLRRIDQNAHEIELERFRVRALTQAAICEAKLDRPDSALAHFEQATALWERERTVPLDAQWRALRSGDAVQLATQYASLVLTHPPDRSEEARRRDAFDVLQRFKARTLLERMVFPGQDLGELAESSVTLEELQNVVLQPGELLLDVFSGDPMMVAAVTRDECRVLELDVDEAALQDQVELVRKLVAAPSSDGESIASVTLALSERLLSDVDDLLDHADHVLFAPGGATNLVPMGLLRRPSDPQHRPLLATHEVTRLPSASALAWYRRGGADTALEHRKLLAIAGARAAGQSRLPGAEAEVRTLARRYQGVEVREPADAAATLSVLNELQQFEVVHVSAHADLDDEQPWRSGIVLGVGDPADGLGGSGSVLRSGSRPGELVLRASDIVGLDLGARLAVLSACETAGGKIVTGEGVQGLTTAFLGAGVHSVVATLWPVSDASTAQWVDAFYQALADGLPVAGALQQASLRLRADPATSHPFHWAGFVLVGDGNTEITLYSRAAKWRLWLVAGLALVGTLGMLWRRRVRADAAA